MSRKFDGSELVLATHNAGKVREISDLLKPYISDFFSAGDLNLPEPEETGMTFIENAELKALASALASGKPALADDSGLSVTALGGDPGIYSARWAQTSSGERDFTLAMQKVRDEILSTCHPERSEGSRDSSHALRMTEDEKEVWQQTDRSAAFICALSLVWPDGHKESFEGRVEGQIVWPARGEKGFGYDPIFVPNGYDITFAEMDSAEKQKISHRADAFAKLVQGCFS